MSGRSEPLFGADLGELRSVSGRDLAIRFAFGAGISVVSGVGGIVLGATVGGMLLAFPAIAPATLTLIERQDGNAAAVHDVGGAVFGAVGLVAFAVVGDLLFGRTPAPAVLFACLAAWMAVSLALYVARAEGLMAGFGRQPPGGPDRPSPGGPDRPSQAER